MSSYKQHVGADLSDLPQSKSWLEQFDEEDYEIAVLLLRRLRCISPNLFNSEIRQLFEETSGALEKPIALYAAREIPKGTKYFKNQKNRPDAVVGNKAVGSEGSAAHLVTTIAREKNDVFLNHSPIMTLKKKKCRSILICDDTCASGMRVAKFISNLLECGPIKSWLSGGFIRFHVLAYAISVDAEKRIREAIGGDGSSKYVHFHYCQRLAIGAQLWSTEERDRIAELCEKYGEQHKIRWEYRLGFGQAISTLVLAHSCPNNVPGILWAKTPTWTPLFPGRAIPQPLLQVFTEEPSEYQQSVVLKGLGAETVAESRLYTEGSQRERDMILVLAAVRGKCRKPTKISTRIGLSHWRTNAAIAECKRFGLVDEIDDELRLTQGGRKGLQLAEARAHVLQVERINTNLYFPTSLRTRGVSRLKSSSRRRAVGTATNRVASSSGSGEYPTSRIKPVLELRLTAPRLNSLPRLRGAVSAAARSQSR